MPAISPRPAKRSFYPDWYVLVHAFEGAAREAPAALRDLNRLIHDVAESANLCLSFSHILELLRAANREEQLERARWLDTLDVVWLRDHDEALEWEMDRFLRRSIGLPVEPAPLPALPASLLSLFRHWTPAHVAEVLLKGTIFQLVLHIGDSEEVCASLEKFTALGPYYNRRIFDDRQLAKRDELSDSELRAFLKAKLDRSLLEQVLSRNQKLGADDQNYRYLKNGFWVAPDDEFVKSKMKPLDELRNDFPSVFIFQEAIRNAGFRIAQKKHTGTGWFNDPDRKGDVLDWAHLIGAAYCDVFTCDRATSKYLGDLRVQLGRSKELYREGDLSLFVEKLRNAVG
jgi:hypothetical protein